MDSKIILAVLIVALIGIVAATYQGETKDMMNSLANVATEDSNAAESVTDLAEASSDGANSPQVDESIVQPDSSVNSKVDSTPKSSNNNNNQHSQAQNPTSSSDNSANTAINSGSNSDSNSGNNGGNNINNNTGNNANNNAGNNANTSTSSNTQQPNSTTNNNQNQQSGITEAQAMSIAKNSLPNGVTSDYQKVSETTINGKTYYEVNLYKNGEIIAYSEIDSNGKVTGGAIKGEAPEI